MIDWFGLLAVQGTLKILLQNHNLKASILQCSVFFMVQITSVHGYCKKIIALTIGNFVDKVMFLLLSMLHTFVIAFLPVEVVTDFLFSWAPKSLWTVTAIMKLKDACSLEGKLCTLNNLLKKADKKDYFS